MSENLIIASLFYILVVGLSLADKTPSQAATVSSTSIQYIIDIPEDKPLNFPTPIAPFIPDNILVPAVVAVEKNDRPQVTLVELRKLAKDKGISGYSKMKRDKLMSLVG